jgi:hypothetical protein
VELQEAHREAVRVRVVLRLVHFEALLADGERPRRVGKAPFDVPARLEERGQRRTRWVERKRCRGGSSDTPPRPPPEPTLRSAARPECRQVYQARPAAPSRPCWRRPTGPSGRPLRAAAPRPRPRPGGALLARCHTPVKSILPSAGARGRRVVVDSHPARCGESTHPGTWATGPPATRSRPPRRGPCPAKRRAKRVCSCRHRIRRRWAGPITGPVSRNQRFLLDRFDAPARFRGTFAPFSRASLNPMANRLFAALHLAAGPALERAPSCGGASRT